METYYIECIAYEVDCDDGTHGDVIYEYVLKKFVDVE